MFSKRFRSALYVKKNNLSPQQQSKKRFWISVVEIIVFLIILNLLGLLSLPQYEKAKKRSTLSETMYHMHLWLGGLMHYQIDYPNNRFIEPDNDLQEPGIVLSPFIEPKPQHMQFLIDLYSLMDRVPVDPYMTELYADNTPYTSLPLRWTRTRNSWEQETVPFEHHGWGILSIGPSYEIPPQYDITVLRKVPYFSFPIKLNLFDPSNGINSIGFLYADTYGNGNTHLKDEDLSDYYDYSEGKMSK